MRIAISNLAWDPDEDSQIADILREHSVGAIDVAPGKYFANPKLASDLEIKKVRDWWSERNVEITGMQALLFGTTGLNLFGSNESRQQMLDHLSAICRIGAGLHASRLVFGSPKNRDRGTLSDSEVLSIATEFFAKLGDIAALNGVTICLEPNPTLYGANFMTTSIETARMVQSVAHGSIKMQLDLGSMTINQEDPSRIADIAPMVGHIHVSEPNLMPIGDHNESPHLAYSKMIRSSLFQHVVTIEMLSTKNEPHIKSVSRAIKATNQYYGDLHEQL